MSQDQAIPRCKMQLEMQYLPLRYSTQVSSSSTILEGHMLLKEL